MLDPNLTQSHHHAAIGGVAIKWTHLENYVQSILWRIAGLNPIVGRCITNHMPFRSVCDAIVTIANETPAYQKLVPELKAIFHECEQLKIKRNDTVHALWAIFVPTGNEQTSVRRLAGEFDGMVIKARGALNIKINRTTVSQINEITEEIIVLTNKLANFVEENIPK
jgi:hypothetical protein